MKTIEERLNEQLNRIESELQQANRLNEDLQLSLTTQCDRLGVCGEYLRAAQAAEARAIKERDQLRLTIAGFQLERLKLLRPSVQFGAYILPGEKPEKLMSLKEDPREAKKALALLKRLDAESLTLETQPTDGLQLTKDA